MNQMKVYKLTHCSTKSERLVEATSKREAMKMACLSESAELHINARNYQQFCDNYNTNLEDALKRRLI